MKIFALLFLFGIAAATTEFKWETGKLYKFEYSGRLLTGIPALASQYSGLAINATVELSAKSNTELHLTIQEPKFVKINDVLEPVEDNIPSTYDGTNWRRLRLPNMVSVPEEYRTILSMPVVIRLAPNGEVTEVVISKKEPEWSVNYKKGIVSLFQTKVYSASLQIQENRLENPITEPRNIWKVQEETVSGKCEATYVVNKLPEYIVKEDPTLIPFPEACPEKKFYEVIRTVDYMNCEKRASFSHYRPGQFLCGNNNPLGNCASHWTRSSTTRYIACGSRSVSSTGSLVIQSIVNDGEFNYPVLGSSNERIVSGSLQTLKLKEIVPSTSFPEPTEPVTIETLMYEYTKKTYGYSGSNSISEQLYKQGRIPKSELHSGKVLSKSLPRTFLQGLNSKSLLNKSEFIKEIKNLLKQVSSLIHHNSESLTEAHINMKLLSVVRGLSTLESVEEINQLYSSLLSEVSEEEKTTIKQLFVDTIMITGTPQTLEFVEQLIRVGNMSQSDIQNFFMWLPSYVIIPSEQVLNRLFKLITKTEALITSPTVYSIAITGFTQLVQSACISEARHTIFPTHVYGEFCNPESEIVQQKLIPYLVRQLHDSQPSVSSSTENIKNIHIVALGLLQHNAVITELTPIIEGTMKAMNPEESLKATKVELSRILATYSLANIGRTYPDLVMPVMLSIFTNPSESTEMRVIAFNSLLKINPPMKVFHTIASVTQSETSMDYELLKTINIALYTIGQEVSIHGLPSKTISLIEKCKAAYSLVKKTYGIVPSTGTWYKTEFLKEFDSGYEGFLSWISGQESVLPKNAYLSLSYFFNNYYINAYQVGFRFSGYDSLLDKVSSALSSSVLKSSSSSEIKEQIKNGLNSEWKKIVEKLQLKTRESEELSGSVFLRLFDSGILFHSFSEKTSEVLHETIAKVLKNPSFLRSKEMSLNFQKIWDSNSLELLIPTDMGFPLTSEFHTPLTASLIGKAEIQPESLTPKMSFSGKVIFAHQMIGWTGTLCPFTQEFVVSGVNRNSVINHPTQVDVSLDIPNHKFSLRTNFGNLAKPVDLYHFNIMPYTVNEKIHKLVPLTESPNLKPIKSTTPVKYWETTLGESLGIHLKAVVKTESRHIDAKAFLDLLSIYKNPVNFILLGFNSPALSEYMLPSIRSHQLIVRYFPSQSLTKEFGFDVTLGCATKRVGQEIKYHTIEAHHSELSSSIQQEALEAPTIPSILQTVLPYTVRSVSIQSSPVHQHRQEKLKQVMTSLESEESTGFFVNVNFIFKSSRPMSFSYSFVAATGSSQPGSGMIKQKWNLKLETPHTESPVNMICVTGDVKFPILPMWNISQLRNTKFHFNNVIGFGSSSCTKSKIVTTGNAIVSDKQLSVAQQSSETKECLRLSSKGIRGSLASPVCEKARLQASTLDEVDFKTEFVKVPEMISYVEHTFLTYLKAFLWPYYSPVKSVPNKQPTSSYKTYTTLAKFQFKQYTPSYDLTIVRPDETLVFKDIHVTYPFNLFFPLKAVRNNLVLGSQQVTTGSQLGQTCLIDSKSITTYDNKTIFFPTDKCFHLISADCSEYHRFGVISRTMEGEKKEVKVYLKKTEIHIIPTTSSINGPRVLVDGSEKTIPVGKTVQVLSTHDRQPKAYVTRTIDGVIVVKSPQLMLDELRTNGKLIQIYVSPLLKNKLCGVCGDFNNQVKADIAGPSKCIYSKPELEVASYRIESESCPPLPHSVRSELVKETEQCAKYQVNPSQIAKSYKVSTGKCTFLKHISMQQGRQICISKVPVTQCGPSCKPESSQLVHKSVPFTCFASTHQAQDILNLPTQQITKELAGKPTTFSSILQQPTHCVHSLVNVY